MYRFEQLLFKRKRRERKNKNKKNINNEKNSEEQEKKQKRDFKKKKPFLTPHSSNPARPDPPRPLLRGDPLVPSR